jgi:hypothetical protein
MSSHAHIGGKKLLVRFRRTSHNKLWNLLMESTENLLPNRAVSEKAEVYEALIQARGYSIDGRVKKWKSTRKE